MRCDDDALQSIILRILIQIGRQAGQRANEFNSNYVTDVTQFLLLLVVNACIACEHGSFAEPPLLVSRSMLPLTDFDSRANSL